MNTKATHNLTPNSPAGSAAVTRREADPQCQPPILDLQGVSKSYTDGPNTVFALDDVSLTVEPGQLVAIMGPSGSGKSTLLHVAGALAAPSGGRVLINGCDISSYAATELADIRREEVGFVFQDFNLMPTLTVAENIALPLELGGVKRGEARREAMKALEELELSQLAERFPAECSGGQRQRVAIARALVGKRNLLLADEPTGALDTSTAEKIMELLRSRVDAGAGALWVTHEPRFAA